MSILESYTPNIELYSIDEAFLEFKGFDHFDLDAHGRKMKKTSKAMDGHPRFCRHCTK